jgi:hypothetical protein
VQAHGPFLRRSVHRTLAMTAFAANYADGSKLIRDELRRGARTSAADTVARRSATGLLARSKTTRSCQGHLSTF